MYKDKKTDCIVITALFDINRDKYGDGRSIEDYLHWFSETLCLKCDMLIFTEEKFSDFVIQKRSEITYRTEIVIQKIEDIPFYTQRDTISRVIQSGEFLSKMKDTNRIECYLPEYNIIQYSKFGWLKYATDNYDYLNYIWMDAGCSRFFTYGVRSEWPENSMIFKDKVTIQGNINYINTFVNMVPDDYIWDNNSMLVGTLFGGNSKSINKLFVLINQLYNEYLQIGCINNEQFLLAIAAKKEPDLFNILTRIDGTHLPLFDLLSK